MNSNVSLFSSWIHLLNQLFEIIENHFKRLSILTKLISDFLSKQNQSNENLSIALHELFNQIQDHLISLINQQLIEHSIQIEYLTIEQFTLFIKSFQNLIHFFVSIDSKYNSTPFKTFLQNQINKYLNYFHDQRKQRLSNTLDNEQWRQVSFFFSFSVFIRKIEIVVWYLGSNSTFDSKFDRWIIFKFVQRNEFNQWNIENQWWRFCVNK